MSHALYTRCLLWQDTRGGIAKLHGRIAPLSKAPEMPGLHIAAMHYVPEIGLRQLKPCGRAWRDMTDEEVKLADEALAALTAAVTTSC